MTTTWWKRCYEGLDLFHLFILRIVTGRVGGFMFWCLFVCFFGFGVASDNSAINWRFTSFADFQLLTHNVSHSLCNAGKKTDSCCFAHCF